VSRRAGGATRRWRWVLAAVVLVALGMFVWVALTVRSAGQAGYEGKEALEPRTTRYSRRRWSVREADRNP